VTNDQTVCGGGFEFGRAERVVATADADAADHPVVVVVARRIQEQNEGVLVAGFDSGGTPSDGGVSAPCAALMAMTGELTSSCAMVTLVGRPERTVGTRPVDEAVAVTEGAARRGSPTTLAGRVAPAAADEVELAGDDVPAWSSLNCRYAPAASTHAPAIATAPLHRSGARRPRRRAELTSDAVPSAPPECDSSSPGEHQTSGGEQQTTRHAQRTVATGNRIG
jgi:hypothetical protein